MAFKTLTNLYLFGVNLPGNFAAVAQLVPSLVSDICDITVSLLRSRLSRLAFDEIPERFSSSLPPLFASGRFATFLSSAR
jgi:hypothetical protein